MEDKCAFGLTKNQASGLSYVFGWISGIIFLVAEKDNREVRFHAMQSTVLFLALSALSWIARLIPFLGGFLGWALGVITFVAWLYLLVSGLTGKNVRVPILGDIAWEQVNK